MEKKKLCPNATDVQMHSYPMPGWICEAGRLELQQEFKQRWHWKRETKKKRKDVSDFNNSV